jgi:hypothetical protein
MPSVVEPVARFTTAWLLAGFTAATARDGVAPTGKRQDAPWQG